MAQNHGRDLIETLPHVDLVVGTDRLHEIPELVDQVRRGTHGLVATDLGTDVLHSLSAHEERRITAFVAVMRGCNQFCSYCIVPYVRGREKSRPVAEVVAEVRRLAESGTREVLLLGQNITAYGVSEARKAGTYDSEHSAFADLLAAVHEVPGISRIRFTSPHVRFMNDHFIETICTLPKVCKAFHIPVQSGANRILGLMNRGYTAEEYLDRVGAVRQRLPEATFSTDVIVGFPGETEAEFDATRELMEQVGFDMAYIFRYSVRTGTKAAEDLEDDVSEDLKMARNKILLEDLERRSARHNRKLVGRTMDVLVEGASKRNTARWSGRTDTNKVCIFTPRTTTAPGDILPVTITRTTPNSLFGELADG
jgi:tRNA-2-methylthio-N6-dimethylallyladenosine synthase